MKKSYLLILFSLFFICSLAAENPKREVRAVWLSTVWALDWPSTTVPAATGSNETARVNARESQKRGLNNILDKLEEANFNTIYFQVRGMSDAFYQSAYEPWSQYLSSARGADPGWDPLAYLIDAAHARGIELHAWLNPYRYSTAEGSHGNLPTDYANSHPNWLMDYGAFTKILNPGIPEVRERIYDVVEDIVVNYDVDGIVFDDYFYVQGTTNALDEAQFHAYNPNGLSRADWRRENVNIMVRGVYTRINSLKPYVSFGISPAGVSASDATVAAKYDVPKAPVGSDWQYNGIYSDPLAWYKDASVDFVSPQIYWKIGSGNDYSKLSPWWAKVANHFGRNYYSSNTSSFGGAELVQQIQINRDADQNGTTGSVYFRTNDLALATLNTMKADLNSNPALHPAYGWKQAPIQGLVENLTLSGQNLSWNYSVNLVRYVVYAIPNANKDDNDVYTTPKYQVGVAYEKTFTLPNGVSNASHKIAVAVYDRFGNLFPPRVLGENTTTTKAAQLSYPANGQEVVLPALFSWNAVSGASYYIWELAKDASFTEPIATRETANATFNSGSMGSLKDNTNYFWRVKVIKPNAPLTISEVRSFHGEKFKILSPVDGQEKVSMSPAINWNSVGEGANYTIEISTRSDFSSLTYSAVVTENSHNIPEGNLAPATTYYVQIRAQRGDIQAISERVRFETVEVDIPVPVIVSPATSSVSYDTEIELVWQKQASRGFRIELSKSNSFPSRSTTIKTTEPFVYSVIFDNLQEGIYYLRVKAQDADGLTEASDFVMVDLRTPTAVDRVDEQPLNAYFYRDAKGVGQLQLESDRAEKIDIAIYSVTGALITKIATKVHVGKNTIPLQISGLSESVYLLKFQLNEQDYLIKIIK